MSGRLSRGGLLLSALAACLSALGIALIKSGLGAAAAAVEWPMLLAGLVVYGLGVVCGIVLLGRYAMSLAYPVVVGLSLVILAAFSAAFLHETLTPGRLGGAALIVLGVWFIAGSTRSARD